MASRRCVVSLSVCTSQLKVKGKMIIPVGPDGGDQYLCLVEKVSADQIRKQVICGVRYVPLTSADSQKDKSLF